MSQFHAYEDDAPPRAVDWAFEGLLNAGLDDRRSIARAYRGWTDRLGGRVCPSIEDLEPAGVAGPGDMLIDLRRDREDPELVCIGGALLVECGTRGMRRLSQAPAGSFLGLLAAHHRYAASARHPIAFDGERLESDGRCSTYRAILLPFSSDGESVDFVHGRISWRRPAEHHLADEICSELELSGPCPAIVCTASVWPQAPALELTAVS